jgi:hypothetical protein
MMSQRSSCDFKGRKKDVVLTTDDIAEDMVRPFLPLVGCPGCEDHLKVIMRVSQSIANLKAYYVKCARYRLDYQVPYYFLLLNSRYIKMSMQDEHLPDVCFTCTLG